MAVAKVYQVKDPVTIYNAKLMFRNFSGEETQYNPKGSRNFCIFLDAPIAEQMEKDGWTIRYLDSKDGGDPQPVLSVKVSFGNIPPNIVVISQGRQSRLSEEKVNMLDWAEIEFCDVQVNPFNWGPIGGKSGCKAYLKSLYATLVVDELAAKYNYHEGADEAIGGCGNCEVCDGNCGSTSAL